MCPSVLCAPTRYSSIHRMSLAPLSVLVESAGQKSDLRSDTWLRSRQFPSGVRPHGKSCAPSASHVPTRNRETCPCLAISNTSMARTKRSPAKRGPQKRHALLNCYEISYRCNLPTLVAVVAMHRIQRPSLNHCRWPICLSVCVTVQNDRAFVHRSRTFGQTAQGQVVADALGYHHHTTTRAVAQVTATWTRYATGPRAHRPSGWAPTRDS